MDAGSRSPVGHALAIGVTVNVASLTGEQPFVVPAMLQDAGIRSLLIVPIGGGADGLFGTVGVYSRTAGQFGAEDEAFLSACTHVVAEAVQRQKNETVLQVTARQQSALAEIAGRFRREPVDQPIRACNVIAHALETEYAAYLEIDRSGEFAVVVDAATWLGGPGARVPLNGTQAAYTIETAGPVVIADLATETRFNARPYFEKYGLRSEISVPVRGHSGILGVIKVATHTRRDFNADAVPCLQALADLVAEGLERRKTHRELAASRERYRNVFEGAAEVMVTITPTGRILTLNQAFERITGWPIREWIGRDFIDLIPEDDRERSVTHFADALRDGRGAASTRVFTADGGTRDIEGSWVVATTDGRVDEIFGFGRDVTERLRIEQARARLADELSLILDSVAEGIYRFDANGNCSMINRAAVDMLGGVRPYFPRAARSGRRR
ncbi:MAG TPA: PAS domain S-box protein [Thermoanaerobaculia bacterium]|jgi:PAS domain S-box-containing protein